jgi:hypothetical protein
MSLPNKKGWLAIAFILFSLAVPFGITYYVSTSAAKARYEDWRARGELASAGVKSQISANQLLLIKDERVKVKNTGLVFKGLDNEAVMVDLYLLELDPSYAYPQRFSRKINGRSVRLGDVIYSVKSVNNSVLTLKILQAMGTR